MHPDKIFRIKADVISIVEMAHELTKPQSRPTGSTGFVHFIQLSLGSTRKQTASARQMAAILKGRC